MSTFTINGKTFITEGHLDSVFVMNGEVSIGGRAIDLGEFASSPVINITVEGPVNNVSTQSANVTVNGDVGAAKTMSGNVKVEGAINGDVSTMSGDVRVAGSISGNVKSVSGDIRSKA